MCRAPHPTTAPVVTLGVQVSPCGFPQHPTIVPEDSLVLHCEVAPCDPQAEGWDPIPDPRPGLCVPPPLPSSLTPTPRPPSHSIEGLWARRWPPCPTPPSSWQRSPPECEPSPAEEGLVPESLPHPPNPPSWSSIIKTTSCHLARRDHKLREIGALRLVVQREAAGYRRD